MSLAERKIRGINKSTLWWQKKNLAGLLICNNRKLLCNVGPVKARTYPIETSASQERIKGIENRYQTYEMGYKKARKSGQNCLSVADKDFVDKAAELIC